MRTLAICCSLLLAMVAPASADHFKTRLLTSSSADDQFEINVPEGATLRIIDFVYDGSGEYFITVTRDSVTARVLVAGRHDDPKARDAVVVAGPATIAVTKPTNETRLFLTFRKRANSHGDP